MHAASGAPKTVDVITTDDRKKLLLERKEEERLSKEKLEREAAESELFCSAVKAVSRLPHPLAAWCPSPAPAVMPPQGAPGGPVQPGTPGVGPGHWDP